MAEIIVASFGAGLNSTAMLVEWVNRGMPAIAKILFADTGGERDATYRHTVDFSKWLVEHGQPAIEVTKKGGRTETLEEYCLRVQMLPSLAYGRKGCSHKFKIEPQERDINRFAPARAAWKRGEKVVKLLGYGFDEQRRIGKARLEDDKYIYRFPLNEWEMDRDNCAAVIHAAGLAVPGKSACFFCPASTKAEISALAIEHPDLLARALRIEDVAAAAGKATSSKGLGRRFAWRDYLAGQATDNDQLHPCLHCVDQ